MQKICLLFCNLLSFVFFLVILFVVVLFVFVQEGEIVKEIVESVKKVFNEVVVIQLDCIMVMGLYIYCVGYDILELVVVVFCQDIDVYGYINLIDVLIKIFGVFVGVFLCGDQVGFGVGVNFVSCFGLGSNCLLILVNGCCFVILVLLIVFGVGGGLGIQVDMNVILIVMVECVESLSIGGVFMYGFDVILGVNNIILCDKFEGVEVELGFGRIIKNDNDCYFWFVIFGSGFVDGCGYFIIVVELDNSEGVNVFQCDFYCNGYSLQINLMVVNVVCFQLWCMLGNDGCIDFSILFNIGLVDGIVDQVWICNWCIFSMIFGGLIMLLDIQVWCSYQCNVMGELNGFGLNNKFWYFNDKGDLVVYDLGIFYFSGNVFGGDGFNFNEIVLLIVDFECCMVYLIGSFDFNDNVCGFFELLYYSVIVCEILDQNVYNVVGFGVVNFDGSGDQSGVMLFSVNNLFFSVEFCCILVENGIILFCLLCFLCDLSMNNVSIDMCLSCIVFGLDGFFDIGECCFNWEISLIYG